MPFRPLMTLTSVLAFALIGTTAVHAALTTGGCLAAKVKAAGNLQKCRAGENAKVLQGKAGDLTKCATKFVAALLKLDGKASDAAVACRYSDNGDGTVTDVDTGLVWEKKTGLDNVVNAGDPHDADNVYTWSSSGTSADGTAFTDFLAALNDGVSSDPSANPPVTGCFANHCDWRLPSIAELQGIVDLSLCANPGACIDPAFGPTPVYSYYWSATTVTSTTTSAWDVKVGSSGAVLNFGKSGADWVRAVRGGW